MDFYQSIKTNKQYFCSVNGVLIVESVNIFQDGKITIVMKSPRFLGAYTLEEFLELKEF